MDSSTPIITIKIPYEKSDPEPNFLKVAPGEQAEDWQRQKDEGITAIGWEELGDRISIRCFMFDPSITSSLRFLRKTPWARTKVEKLYLRLPGVKKRS